MEEDLKISLVIPAYNEEKYIGACLEYAIKNSSGKFFEIIVVDNASTDHTGEIAKSFPGVRVVREENKGLTKARQRGFVESTGNIVANIDADTQMPKGWVEKIIEEFKKDKNLVCLSGPYVYYDIPAWQSFLVKSYWLLAIPIYWITGYMATGGNHVIKRETLEKMNGFDTKIEFFGEDANTARRASKYGKVKFKLRFIMPTSGRRLTKDGLLKNFIIYTSQFFSEAIAHKPIIKKHKNIR
ncbi:glycosyltransferase [Patescibacteria group bacterium]|nr:glycosyltransferase [Patescibacteria group bacterium]MBU1727891.1 glycosyltransferase [Patescibacteria group bacterium]